MSKRITVLPGDGVGPEVTNQALKVIAAINERFGHSFLLQSELFGACSIDKYGVPLSEKTLEACLQSDAILLGAIGHPKYDSDPAAKVRPEQGLLQLRKSLGLHTNIRPVRSYKATKDAAPLKNTLLEGVDMLIFRELTGGLYFGEKKISADGTEASDSCKYTRNEIERIAVKAFEAARSRRGKLTLVDKANVLETSRLWRKVVQEISAGFPDVSVEYMFVDNAAMQLMLNPKQFDVILTENLFGDILSDLAGVISGSIGLLPSASIGTTTALFEPIHGSYPQAAGKDIANPVGAILSVAMMYDYFQLRKEAKLIRDAVIWSLKKRICTPDILQKDASWCSQVGDYISLYIEKKGKEEPILLNEKTGVLI